LPFAAWVIQEVAPRTFVELGTHSGNSYFSFCQSVVEARLTTKCYAIDTWQGDEHAGQYDEEIFAKVNAYNQEQYSGFSRLLRMTFDAATNHFMNESIDLLHIDGLHTYEAIQHDFYKWLPKLTPGAVVILHDTNVRERNFGVWKFWEELRLRYPSNLEFEHSYGLGVLQLDNAPDDKKLGWLQPGAPEKQKLINYFTALGSRLLERFEIDELKRHIPNFSHILSKHEWQVKSYRQKFPENDKPLDSSANTTQIIENDPAVKDLSSQLQNNKVVKHYDTCIILHLYYPNMWSEILSYLLQLDKQFDLIITIPFGVNISEDTIRAGFPDAQIYRCENLGRDVLPFLTMLSAVSKLDYKYLCKIHTKQNTYSKLGINWRQDMLDRILGSRDIVAKIKKAMDDHPDWGIIAPKGYVVPKKMYWRDNAEKVSDLIRLFNLPTDNIEFLFVAGTMFWFRPQVFSLLTSLETLEQDFELEQEQNDGTLSNAFERFFGMVTTYAGYKIAESDLREIRLSDVSPLFQILAQEIENFRHMVQEYSTQAAERDKQIENFTNTLVERDKQIYNYTNVLVERDKQMYNYTNVLVERDKKIYDLLDSKSWRLTKPLRFLYRIIVIYPISITRRFPFILINIWNKLPLSPLGKHKFIGAISKILPFLNNWVIAYRQQSEGSVSFSESTLSSDVQMQNTNSGNGCNPQNVIQSSARSDSDSVKKQVEHNLKAKLQVFLNSGAMLEFPVFDNPVVSVIILFYNHAEMSLQCLQSLKAETGNIQFEVIIIDNNSKDDTPYLLERIHNVKIIRNSHNLGFSGGCNQGVAHASGKYLLFLNNDAQILPNSIKVLYETLENDSNIGAVGGKLIFPDGRLQEAGSIIWHNGSCSSYGRNDGDPSKPEYSFVRDVDFCSGAFLMTPKSLFISLGGFDTRYSPAYYEDADYCMSVWKNNLRVVFQPFAAAIHNEFGSSNESKAVSLHIRNNEKFAAKWNEDLRGFGCRNLSETIFYREHRTDRPRILFIDDQIPDYRLGSGHPRTYQMLQILACLGYKLTFFPMQMPAFIPEITDSLQKIGVEILYDRLLRRINLESFLKSRPDYYDVILVSRPHNMQQSFGPLKNNENKAAILYDAEALYSLREILFNELKGIKLSENKKNELIKSEMKLVRNADIVTAVSGLEKEYFLKFGRSNAHVLGHAVEPSPTPAVFEDRKDILFVGGILEKPSPNEDAVIYFVTRILPLVRKKIDCHFYIVGTNRIDEIWNLQSDFIHVKGMVDDLSSYYNHCRLFVVPTRYSAGIPLKLLEAAAHGLPAVVTPLILKQLNWQENREILVGHNYTDFAQKVISLYSDPKIFYSLRQNALDRIHLEYSKKHFKECIENILLSAMRVREAKAL